MMIFKVGPCGGGGGEPFSIDKVTRIVRIRVYYSTYIHAINITYIFHEDEKTITWGKASGTWKEFSLEPGEYITSVKGYYGTSGDDWNGLTALKFETSETIEPYGPYGKEVGTEFELPAVNGKIIGFFARSGTHLDALGVYVKVE